MDVVWSGSRRVSVRLRVWTVMKIRYLGISYMPSSHQPCLQAPMLLDTLDLHLHRVSKCVPRPVLIHRKHARAAAVAADGFLGREVEQCFLCSDAGSTHQHLPLSEAHSDAQAYRRTIVANIVALQISETFFPWSTSYWKMTIVRTHMKIFRRCSSNRTCGRLGLSLPDVAF